jgi:hypothetical protein
MGGEGTCELYIDAFTPESISMSRLAEYMTGFAVLLGQEEHVHFERLKPGSLSLAARSDQVAHNRVRRRLDEVRY